MATRRNGTLVGTLDVAAVVAFVVIGRASHGHGDAPGGVASTLWPFGCGLVAGWAATRVARQPAASVPGGVLTCLVTVALGMLLRVIAGQGTAPSFVAVATGFLGSVMLGGRLLLRRRARPSRAR